MADSRWRVGTFTSTRTFAKTDAEIKQVLEWFISDKISPRPEGLTDAQENQRRLDFAHEEVLRYVQREAQANRARQLREQQQNIDEQARTETQL